MFIPRCKWMTLNQCPIQLSRYVDQMERNRLLNRGIRLGFSTGYVPGADPLDWDVS